MNGHNRFYKVHPITENVYILRNSFVNMTLIVGKKRALLFDTGFGFADYTEVVRQITELPLDVVVSHGHFDHAGGNRYRKEPVYMHEADFPVEKRYFTPEFLQYAYDSVKKIQNIFFWLPCIPGNLSREKYAGIGAFASYLAVREGDVFDLGGVTLEVVELPGHTPGSIGLLYKEKRLFFVSDAINETVYLHLPESEKLDTYIHTLQKAMRLDFDFFINGHVAKQYPKQRIADYLNLALNLDYPNGRKLKPDLLRDDVEVKNCYKKGIRSRKGDPYLRISADKL